jgi:hypothetical protein
MRCTRVEKFLPLYVAGDLAGRRTERRVTDHLATCESCRTQAAEYEASRDLVRDAATLPPDFDGAFYAELRSSVLAEIKRDRTRLAPPAHAARFAGFASLFNTRFAYAASLVIVAVAALSLYSYTGQKSEDAAHPQNMIANANGARTGIPTTTATPVSTQAEEDGRQPLSSHDETARGNKNRGSQAAESSSLPRRRHDGNAQNETHRSVQLAKRTPVHARRTPRTPFVVPDEFKEQIARSSVGSATDVAPEVSRIEIQTSDPNIRIIWLSPKPEDAVAQPLN